MVIVSSSLIPETHREVKNGSFKNSPKLQGFWSFGIKYFTSLFDKHISIVTKNRLTGDFLIFSENTK